MFRKVLIANRGEIAVAVIRACRDLGIRSVAVYSEADKDALHVHLADEAVCIGPADSQSSYLNRQAIISAAVITGADAIHPGFGFLSENVSLVRLCEQCHIKFIGPTSEAMALMGDKNQARKTAVMAGVPVIPGSSSLITDLSQALTTAREIGYPVIIKAANGGGGRGMRIVYQEKDLNHAFMAARAEAKAAFGDQSVYMERYILNPHHVEIQLLADEHGNVVHLGERDCSIQRRNQKLLEESPSPVVDRKLRDKMGELSVRLAKAVGYTGVGTIEYLVDEDKNFYFMEMNTRIQVEHPVTEMVTQTNLIQEQILVASGKVLSLQQSKLRVQGHAIECRINAEDPVLGFRPMPGEICNLILPGGHGVRVDTALYPGYIVPSEYDSLLAKVIVHAPTRTEAIRRMRRALTELTIDGVATNVDFHLALLRHPDFISGDYDNGFLERCMPLLIEKLA